MRTSKGLLIGFLALLLSALMWPGMHALLASGRISAATFNRWIHLFPSAGIAIFAFTASGQLAWAFARMHHNLGQVKAELETRSLQLAAAKTAATMTPTTPTGKWSTMNAGNTRSKLGNGVSGGNAW